MKPQQKNQTPGIPNHHWPWFQVILQSSELRGKSAAQLSRHVLNLRQFKPVPPPTLAPAKVQIKSTRANFINTIYQQSLSFELYLHSVRPDNLTQLSFWSVLEIIAWCLDRIWLSAAWLFLRLAHYGMPLVSEMRNDVSTYFGFVGQVVHSPARSLWQHLKPSQRTTPITSQLVLTPVRTFDFGSLGLFLLFALVLSLGLKGAAGLAALSNQATSVRTLAEQGVDQLKNGGTQLAAGEAGLAALDFVHAQQTFAQALDQLDALPVQVRSAAARLSGNSAELSAGTSLLRASHALAIAGEIAARTWSDLAISERPEDGELAKQLDVLQAAARELEPQLAQVIAELSTIDTSQVAPELTQEIDRIKEQVTTLHALIRNTSDLPGFLKSVLAAPGNHRFVIMFQNPTELRASGGFLGSLAIIELTDGAIKSVRIPGGGPYDYQGSLEHLIRPPEPLRLVRGTWQLQDANWFFDFPTTARKIQWFLAESGEVSTDGVIALTANVMPELLKLTGPVALPEYNKVLTSENFLLETQSAVELEYDRKVNRPKQFIADLAPRLLERLLGLDTADMLKLTSIADHALVDRSLQIYLSDEKLQQQVVNFGWAGEVHAAVGDYLAIVRSNIGGGKSDATIAEQVLHRVTVDRSGEITDVVTLTRTHRGTPGDVFRGRRNTSYLRFYVPLGSKLVSAYGFTPPQAEFFLPVPPEAQVDADLTTAEKEIRQDQATGTRTSEEFGKTVFGNWLAVLPGEAKSVTLTYVLPFRANVITQTGLQRFSVSYQRQAGVSPLEGTTSLELPEGSVVRWLETSGLVEHNRPVRVKFDLKQDEYLGIVYGATGT